MAKSVITNYTDTTIVGGSTPTITIAAVNFGADFRVEKESTKEATITNITSPIGLPEKFRYAVSTVPDIYAGTSVDRARYAPSKQGVSVLVQLTDTLSVVDSEDPTYSVALPMSAHLVLKVPSNENISSEMIKSFIGRMLSGFFDTGSATNDRIQALLRMSMLPKDV